MAFLCHHKTWDDGREINLAVCACCSYREIWGAEKHKLKDKNVDGSLNNILKRNDGRDHFYSQYNLAFYKKDSQFIQVEAVWHPISKQC